MSARPRTAVLVFLPLLAGVAAALTVCLPRLWADGRLLPARPTQGVPYSTPEPPLADQPPLRPVPVPAPAPAVPAPAVAGSLAPADPPTPVVSLRVRVPACVNAGQELEYRLCVENRSQAAAHHVLVRNPLPANAEFVRATPEPAVREPELQWRLGTLEACARREIVLVLRPTGAGDVKNCARVQFEHGECVCTRVCPTPAAPAPAPLPPPAQARLTLRKIGPERAVLYEPMSFQIVVTNVGTGPAADVRLTDTPPPGMEALGNKGPLSWDVGTLAPGQSRTFDYQAVAKEVGQLCNKAAVTAAGGVREDASFCVTVGKPELKLEKKGPDQHSVQRPATYLLTVTNPGTAAATNVVLTDTLPEKTTFVSASDGGRLLGNQVEWALGTLAPGARRTVQLTLRAAAPGEVINTAVARADHNLKAEAEARTLFEGAAGLTFDVEVKDNPIEVGAETRYIITVLNQGAAAATQIGIVATIPAQMEFVGARAPRDLQSRPDGQRVVFDMLPSLDPKAEAVFEVRVKAKAAGDVTFQVEMRAEQLGATPVRKEARTTIYADLPAKPLPPVPPKEGP